MKPGPSTTRRWTRRWMLWHVVPRPRSALAVNRAGAQAQAQAQAQTTQLIVSGHQSLALIEDNANDPIPSSFSVIFPFF